MENILDTIESLLSKPCYVIDFLPERIPKEADGHYFDIESYLLNSEKHLEFKNKYVNIIFKLMCYYRATILREEWHGHTIVQKKWPTSNPQDIDIAIKNIIEQQKGKLYILFSSENVLLVLDGGDLHLTVFNLSNDMKAKVEKIALSEGLFCWPGNN